MQNKFSNIFAGGIYTIGGGIYTIAGGIYTISGFHCQCNICKNRRPSREKEFQILKSKLINRCLNANVTCGRKYHFGSYAGAKIIMKRRFNSLLKSRFGLHHHITYMYIYRHIKIQQTILYRIIRDYTHLKIHKNYHS